MILEADSSGRSRMDLDFGSHHRREFNSGHNEEPACTWTATDGVAHDLAIHNCWTPGPWFIPTVSLLSAQGQGNVILTYLGKETRGSVAVEHIRVQRVFLGRSSKVLDLIRRLSTADLYLDATTLLPATLAYFTHPEDDANLDIPVEIRFSDYRDVSGVKIPFAIVKLVNGSRLLELRATSAAFNAGFLKN